MDLVVGMTPVQLDLMGTIDPVRTTSLRRGDDGWQHVHELILSRFARHEHVTHRPLVASARELQRDGLAVEWQRSSLSRRLLQLASGDDPWLVIDGKDGQANRYRLAPGKKP